MIPFAQSDNEVVSLPGAVLQRERTPPFISQLPTELLSYTLHLALPCIVPSRPFTSHSYMRALYILRQVAKRWQEMIDGTPSFWAVILSTLPPHVNNTTILRSSVLPLVVTCDVGSENNHQSQEEFLRATVHTRPRWSAIFLNTDDETCMRGFLATPAPSLQTIVIRSSLDDDLDNEPLELLGGETSNIRYVNIYGTFIRWEMGLFTQLKALIISNAHRDGLTTSHIFDFLRASPCLEDLKIDGVGIAPDSPPSPIITLPYLKSIDLQCNSNAVTDSILRQIQAPSCSKFVVSVDSGGGFDPITFLNETLKPFERILREFHVRHGASELSIDSYGFTWQSLSIPGSKCGFWLFIGDFLDPIVIRWVDQILQKEPGLQICFGQEDTLNQAVFGALAPLQCVTRALIAGQVGEATPQIFHFLSTPLGPGSSLPSLPCLRELQVFSIGWSAQDLLDLVQVRSSAFPWIGMDRPNLAINIRRGSFTWYGSPRPILDFATLSKIRGAEGVKLLQFVGPKDADGALAITWNEKASEPTWG